MAEQTCNDAFFGPVVNPQCRGGFDFTLAFQHLVLSIIPAVSLLVVVPPRLYYLRKQHRKVTAARSAWWRTSLFTGFAVVQLICLAGWATSAQLRSDLAIAAAALSTVSVATLWLLSATEQARSVRPAGIVNLYLLVSSAADVVLLRSLWLTETSLLLGVATTIGLLPKLALLLIEARNKRHALLEPYRSLPRESISGIFSIGLFWWLNPFLWRGFRRPLSLDDIDDLGPELKSHSLGMRFRRAWNGTRTDEKNQLAKVTLHTLRWPFLAGVLPRACQTVFKFLQPFLLIRIIDYVNDVSSGEAAVGYGLAGATALVYGGLAISTATYKHTSFRAITMVRGGLTSLIYSKMLRMDVSANHNASAVTLVSTDIQGIVTGCTSIHEFWASPIEVALAVYFLQRRTGLACIAPLVIAIISTLASAKIAAVTKKRQGKWLESVENRLTATSAMLSKIKGLRMLGLLPYMADQVQDLRGKEIDKAKAYLRVDALKNVCANASTLLSPVITLLLFTFVSSRMLDTELTSSTAYYTLNLVALLSSPLAFMLNSLPDFTASLACFARIQEFMNREEKQDYRSYDKCHISHPWTKGPNVSIAPLTDDNEDIEMTDVSAQARERNTATARTAVTICNGDFGYKGTENPVLRNVNLQISTGSFARILGPVGSGKSTLLKALLAETKCFRGDVYLSCSTVAYCGQDYWLQNLSVQENILGGHELDQRLYDQVNFSVGLHSVLEELPQHDQTNVGAGGSTLSGGQAQRVALARAIYSRPSLLLLDDCLSGLDSKTHFLIARRLFASDGLLRRLGCTVVFTRSKEEPSYHADCSIYISKEGTVEVSHLVDQSKTSVISSSKEVGNDAGTEASSKAAGGGKSNAAPIEIVTQLADDASEVVAAPKKHGVWRFYLQSIGWQHCLVYLLLNAAYVGCTRFSQIWVGFWVDASASHSAQNVDGVYGGTYMGIQLGAMALFGAVLLFIFQIMVPRSAGKLHWTLLQTTVGASYQHLARTDPGHTLNRYSQDLTLIDIELPSHAVQFIIDICMCIGQSVIICLGSYYVAALLPVAFLTVYCIQRFYLQTSRQVRLLDLEAKSPLVSHLLETSSGLQTIRAMRWTDRFESKNDSLLDLSQRPFYALFCIQRWLGIVLDLMVAGIAVCLVLFATQFRSHTSGNAIGVALLNAFSFSQTLTTLITSYTAVETSLGAVVRIQEYNATTEQEDASLHPDAETASSEPRDSVIVFKDVSITYDKYQAPVARHVKFSIQRGMKVGICGSSGSGKSSLLASLLRLASISHGSVMVGNHDISSIKSQDVRAMFNVVPQTPVLMPGSVRKNLDPAGAHRDDELSVILDKVGLLEVIRSRGDLDVDMDSLALSQGQQQLFCIARAFLCNGKKEILLLDECTSSMDHHSEQIAMDFVRTQFSGHTVMAVAHRLDTIRSFDLILVMEAGNLVECGAPDDLLAREEGAFRDLWQAQNHQGSSPVIREQSS